MRTIKPLRLALVVFTIAAWAKIADSAYKDGYGDAWECMGFALCIVAVALVAMYVARGALKELYNWVCPPQ